MCSHRLTPVMRRATAFCTCTLYRLIKPSAVRVCTSCSNPQIKNALTAVQSNVVSVFCDFVCFTVKLHSPVAVAGGYKN